MSGTSGTAKARHRSNRFREASAPARPSTFRDLRSAPGRPAAGSLARLVRTVGLSVLLCGATAGHAQQLEAVGLDEFLGDAKQPALGDCLAGNSEGCGKNAAEAARSFSRNELCDLKIVDGSECRAANNGAPPMRPGERTRLLIVEDDPAAEEPLPSIDVEILFAYGSDEPLAESGRELQELAELVDDPRYLRGRFVVIGHTDAAGSEDYNQALSTRRAAAIRDRLVALTNAGHERFIIAGRGESDLKDRADPLAAENRRVQIVLLK